LPKQSATKSVRKKRGRIFSLACGFMLPAG
jgi:hypothetical protein